MTSRCHFPILLLASASIVAVGCTQEVDPGQRFEISVAPLALTGVTGATYDLRIYNSAIVDIATADKIVALTGLTSAQYGDHEGALTYVAPCDANTPSADDNFNTVELVTTGFTSADSNDTFQLPCPDTTPCRIQKECLENADVLVQFNLTVMRNAKQGFFDVAVNFEDIFCSAKVDCLPEPLLHDSRGIRGATVVYGLACTGGPGSGASKLLFDDLVLECGNNGSLTVVTQPNEAGNGNQLSPAHASTDTAFLVFQTAIYQGAEGLTCGLDGNNQPISCQKIYSNTAIGIGDKVLSTSCKLTTRATAGLAGFTQIPGSSAYPFIDVNVPISDGTNRLTCGANPMNAPSCAAQTPTGVCTLYTDVSAALGKTFAHHYP